YLTKTFRVDEPQRKVQDLIDHGAIQWKLNKEQERAYKIVANHATLSGPQQLRMYLGGMGGTGKTQVIKALKWMFKKKKESHRFIVLAPTGTAAALLRGSTYHSMLGMRTAGKKAKRESDDCGVREESLSVAQAQQRLSGVDYVFIDEVSMVSCENLYAISSRL
ncbi:hypothetical protein DFP72DRAFT_746645, partial [Ephemerocybe angulata]